MQPPFAVISASVTSAVVLYHAAEGFIYRHHSGAWEFARGEWFVHGYDSVLTWLPLLLLLLVAWGFQRRSRALAAVGFAYLLVALVAPVFVLGRVFPETPIWPLWVSDLSFVLSVALVFASLGSLAPSNAMTRRAAA